MLTLCAFLTTVALAQGQQSDQMIMTKARTQSSTRISLRRLSLSTAIVSVLAAPAAAQQYIADGDTVVVEGGALSTTGTSETVLTAINGGNIFTTGPLEITTGGTNAFGAYAGSNGSITLSGGSITTTGINSFGLVAEDGAAIRASDGLVISTQNDFSWGASAARAGQIQLTDTTISTLG
ncbi:hypothetical protein LH464_24380, partial [Neorhizobium sp. T786]|nr:hypothetical protein [Neorhizobium xiangyangii]